VFVSPATPPCSRSNPTNRSCYSARNPFRIVSPIAALIGVITISGERKAEREEQGKNATGKSEPVAIEVH
jgi:hypothetical protein